MPYDVKRFIFSVSLCAMLAANPVLATAPTNDEDLDTTHEVYTELSESANGIAGVSYVNRMVNAAGNAAELAEGHAAAAGAHALSAAQSADEAHKVLADKVSIDQGADNKNKAMVTDDAGSVYAGYIAPSMIENSTVPGASVLVTLSGSNGLYADWGQVNSWGIADGAVTTDKIQGVYSDSYTGMTIIAKDANGNVEWGELGTYGLADGAVTTNKIADKAVTADKIRGFISYTGFLASHGSETKWRQVGTDDIADSSVNTNKIADGAVMADKIGADTSAISVGNDTQSFLYAYETGDGSVIMNWGQIRSAGIADGAVTIDKTAGVVGMVPVGGEGATTYGSFWIE